MPEIPLLKFCDRPDIHLFMPATALLKLVGNSLNQLTTLVNTSLSVLNNALTAS